jgi:hypothetical protein
MQASNVNPDGEERHCGSRQLMSEETEFSEEEIDEMTPEELETIPENISESPTEDLTMFEDLQEPEPEQATTQDAAVTTIDAPAEPVIPKKHIYEGKEYTWEELANMVGDKIEQSKMLQDFNKKRFKQWFMLREKVGLRFDWKLISRAYHICQQLDKHNDHFTIIVGDEGTGKTTMAAQFCSWVSPNMNIDDFCYNMPDYVDKLKRIAVDYQKNKLDKNDKSINIDEGGIDLFSREAMRTSNRVLAKTFMVQRFLNVHVTICIPSYWNLDSMVRDHRIKTLIIIPRRSDYKCVVGQGIKIINKTGSKDKTKPLMTLPIPYGMFWEGHFRKNFPDTISFEEYENKFIEIEQELESLIKIIYKE